VGIFNRRMGQLLRFAALVATNDCVAPAYGTQTLADYFAGRVTNKVLNENRAAS
jgi:hypothetical protein